MTGSTTITKHFYAGGLQVAKMVNSTTYYLHQDALGSTRLVATASVGITFSSNYVPYGSNYAVTGKETFMYTGKPYDSATGLYYFGARFYDTSIGRFITQDSYQGSKNDPMSMNRYIYARDNPERMVDPNGHVFIDENGVFYSPKWVARSPSTPVTTCIGNLCTTYTSHGTTTWTEPSGSGEQGPGGAAPTSSRGASTTANSCAAAPDVCASELGNNHYGSEPTIGLGGSGGLAASLIVLPGYKIGIDLNPEEQEGLSKMERSGGTFAYGLGMTAFGTFEGAGAVASAFAGDQFDASVDAYHSTEFLSTGVGELQSSGPEFISGLGEFVEGMFSGLNF